MAVKSRSKDSVADPQVQRLCDEWNKRHPRGTPVILTYNGEEWHSRTAGIAAVGRFGTAQIKLQDMMGMHELAQVAPEPYA